MPSTVTDTHLSLTYGPAAAVEAELARAGERALLVARYGAPGAPPPCAGPLLDVPNRRLDGGAALEVWWSDHEVTRGRDGAVDWAEDGVTLAGAVRWPLAAALEAETREHFGELLDLLAARGYPHLQRVWNYLPGINDELAGVERYRMFNAGRALAFEERFGERAAEARYSSSSAVGAPGDHLVTGFIAARRAGRHLENPRQMPAFRYPARYGPKSPSFCRATLTPAAEGPLLFLSGTASIVGHESRWPGEVGAQLAETLRNVEALAAEAGRAAAAPVPPLAGFALVKTYVRDPADLDEIRAGLARRGVRPEASLYLEADICRAELALEIEGVALL